MWCLYGLQVVPWRRIARPRTVLGIVGRDGAFVEPLAAALAIQQQVTIRPDDRMFLLGDGKLWQLIVQTLALTGCELLCGGTPPAEIGSAFGAGHYDWNRGGCLGGRV